MVTIANRMPLIEGVGDEVIFFAGLMVLVICIVLAWFSTSVAEQPLIRTAVLVIERRHTTVQVTPNQPETIENQSQSSISECQSSTSKSSDVLHNPSGHRETENTENNPGTSNKDGKNCDENKDLKVSVSAEGIVNEQLDEDQTQSACQNVATGRNFIQNENIQSDNIRHRNIKSESNQGDRVVENEAVRNIESDSFCEGDEPKNDEGRILPQQWVELSSVENLPDTSSISDIAGVIRIRLKFLNDSQRLVEGKLEEPLGDFKRRYFREELENDKTVRLIFNGQLLRSDQETLQFYGLFDNCVVHCQISNNVNSSAAMQTDTYAELDVSRFMLPLFGVILGVIWYCRIQYRQFFNATSTFALLGITGLFFISLVALFIPRREHRQPPWFN